MLPNPTTTDKVKDYDTTQTAQLNANTEVIGAIDKVGSILYRLGLIKDYVIEYGSNTNGKWEKWASGKLEQWGTTTQSYSPTSTASGIAYQNGITINLPISFIEPPSLINVSVVRSVGLIWADLFTKSSNETFQAAVFGVSTNATGYITFHSIGRWKL